MLKKTFQNKMNAIRKNAIKATANVLSAPSQLKATYIKNRSDYEVGKLKKARGYKGAPDYDDKGMPTEAFKARNEAEGVRETIRRRNMKK